MNSMTLAHMAITVKDMEESLRFYTEALGFVKAFEIAHPDTGAPWIEYLSVGSGQFLELFHGGSQDNPWKPEKIGFSHLCVAVEDIHAATKRIQDAGFQMDSMPKMGSDNNWQAWVWDPNGVHIELMVISPDSPQAKFAREAAHG